MKQQLLIVSVHSFVDLITNSSSELFICNTDKSLDAVKSVLQSIGAYGYNEPEAAEYDCDFSECPFKAEYDLAHDWDNRHHPVEMECDRKEKEWVKNNPEPAEADEKAYREWHQTKLKFINAWWDYRDSLGKKCIRWMFEKNGLEYPADDKNFDPYSVEKSKIASIYSEISSALSYDYSFKKGDILIHSSSDNSIPYDSFDQIEVILNASRHHLG